MEADNPFGRGPTSIAIREQRPFCCQDFINDPIVSPWKQINVRAGWASSVSLPLRRNDAVIGAFVLYADSANAFDNAIRELLVEMAADISFALENISRELERKRAEAEIERLAFYRSAHPFAKSTPAL